MKGVFYLRAWRPLMNRRFEGLLQGSALLGEPCPACGKPFAIGDETTLVALGPGADEEERSKARLGGWYNAVAVAVHWLCAGGEP